MKKLLLGSVAAVALTASGAAAQEWTAKVGGFFTGAVYYIDADQDGNDFGLLRDAEVHFNFRLAADNGLTFGTQLELEVNDDDGNADFDEAFAFVSGSFGRVEVGEADGAADGPMGSGNVGADFVRAGDNTGLLFDYQDDFSFVSIRSNGADTGDSLKISYFTPTFSGFTAGVSWIPQIGSGDGTVTSLDSSNEQNAFEVGAQWKGEFSGFAIQVGGGWVSDTVNPTGLAPDAAEDDSSFAGGAKVGFAGFEVGANYGYIEADESEHLGVGVAYKTGPWKVGADYGLVLESDNANRDEDQGVAGGVSYSLAPGVVTGVTVEWADNGSDAADQTDDSYSVGLWLSLGY